MKQSKNEINLGEGSVGRLLLTLAVPSVIAQLVNLLYNLVDRIYIGHIPENGGVALTGLGLCFPILMIVTAFSGLIGYGGAPRVAIFMGKGKNDEAEEILGNCTMALIVIALILVVVLQFAAEPLLMLFGASDNTLPYALSYLNIYGKGTLFVMLTMGLNSFINTQGFSKVGMKTVLIGAVCNIILDPVMIFGLGPVPKLGIAGAAYATGIGQCVTLAGYLLFYFARPMHVKVNVANMKTTGSVMKNIYTIGIPATLNLALPSIQVSALNAILAPFPGSYILVLGVYYKLQTFIYLTANGIVQGIRPLVGYNYGAGEYDRVKKITHTSMGLIALVMVMGMAISCAIPQQLMGLFTTSRATMEIGGVALRIISFGFVVSSVSVTFSGVLEGLGKGMPSLLISLARYIVVMLPVSFALSRLLQASGVWYGFAVTEYIVAVLSYYIYKFHMRDIKG